ncbi:MAG: S9 family peptidase [Planctomycetota bacterium]
MSKRPLTPEDLWQIPRVGRAAPSPDGTLLLVPVTTHDLEENRGRTRLWLHESGRKPRALTAADADASQPRWSPDGTRIAFVRQDDEKKSQIFVLDLRGGEAQAITACEEGATDPRWYPDGKRIAFAMRVRVHEKEERAYVSEERVPRFWDRWLTDGLRWHIATVSAEGGDVTDLMPRFRSRMTVQSPEGGWDLAPDGKEIVFSAMRSKPKARTRWGLYRLRAGKKPELLDTPGWDAWRPRYSPDGRQVLFGWAADDPSWARQSRLATLDRKSGRVQTLADKWTLSPLEWEWSGTDALCLADVEGRVGLFRVSRRAQPFELRRGGTYTGLTPAAGRVFTTHSSLKRPWEVVSCAADGSDERRETRHTAAAIKSFQLGKVEDVTFRGADDAPVQMFLVHPPKPRKKQKLLHLIHGGPHGHFGDIWHPRWCAQAFAAQGYLCACVNFHGSKGWGDAFANSIVGAWGDKPYRDIMAATDWLIEKRGVDKKRMAVSGGSYGGYLTTWITTQTNRFACAVNHAGVCDKQTQFGSEIPENQGTQAGGDLWSGEESQAALDRYNPLRHVGGIKTPTLILHGEQDYRVPYIQALQLYNILQLRRVPTRIAIYPDENHWILKPANSVHWYGEFLDWLKRWMNS